MKMYKAKTKVMVCNCERKNLNIRIGEETIQVVEEFCYLGSIIAKDGRSKHDEIRRLARTKVAFYEKLNFFTSKIDIDIEK